MTRRAAHLPKLAIVLLLCAAAAPTNPVPRNAGPADPVIARSGANAITASQLRAMLNALPADARARIAADPAALTDLLRNTLLQDTLFAEAHAAGWDARPAIAAQAEQARRAVIARTYAASRLPPPATPTDAQIASAYEANTARLMLPRQYHLRQIFLAAAAAATPAQAEQQRQRLLTQRAALQQNPQQFAAVAAKLSDDKASGANAGDLGWLREDRLAEPIRGIVMGLQEGAVSDPIRTNDGWHLINLVETRKAAPAPLAEARPAIIQALQRQQAEAATRIYLDQVLAKQPVQINEIALTDIAR